MAFAGSTPRQKEAPRCGNLHILHIGTTSSKFTVSIQHIRNMSAIWDQLWLTDPLGSNWVQYAATWPQVGSNFGPSWAPHGAKYELLKHAFSRVFWGHRWCFDPSLLPQALCPTHWAWAALAAKRLEFYTEKYLGILIYRYQYIKISIYEYHNLSIDK